MAKRQDGQAALTVVPQETDALAQALDFDFEVSGLEEVDAEDLKFAVKVWNRRTQKPDGKTFYRVNEFFDTLTEQTSDELHCIFVTLHKTNDYTYFDKAKDETIRVCSSYDREVGQLRVDHPKLPLVKQGTERKCEGCPDADWRKDEQTGKNVRNCSTVYGVIGLELDARGQPTNPFMVRFKRTGLAPFKTHLQRHHIRRRKDPKTGKMVDVPLFAYAVTMSLQADKGGLFAVPVIKFRDTDERGQAKPLPRELLMQIADQARSFREMATDVTKLSERKEAATGVDNVIDTTGDPLKPGDFAD